MEYRGSGGHLLRRSIPQCFNAFPIPPISLSVSIHSIAIAPSPTPAIWKPTSIAFSSILPASIHFKMRHIFIPFVCSTFYFQSFASSLVPSPIMCKSSYRTTMYLNSLVLPRNCIDFPSSLCALPRVQSVLVLSILWRILHLLLPNLGIKALHPLALS